MDWGYTIPFFPQWWIPCCQYMRLLLTWVMLFKFQTKLNHVGSGWGRRGEKESNLRGLFLTKVRCQVLCLCICFWNTLDEERSGHLTRVSKWCAPNYGHSILMPAVSKAHSKEPKLDRSQNDYKLESCDFIMWIYYVNLSHSSKIFHYKKQKQNTNRSPTISEIFWIWFVPNYILI